MWADWGKAINYQVDFERLNNFPIKRDSIEDYFKKNKNLITQFFST